MEVLKKERVRNAMMSSYQHQMTLRKPYQVEQLPIFAKLYQWAYDHAPLSKPSIFYRGKTLLRLLTYLAYKSPFLKKPGTFSININGLKHSLSFQAKNSQYHAIYFDRFLQGYEPETCALIDLLLGNQCTFCDIGANWGFYVGFVASKPHFQGKIMAFEPQREIYKELKTLSNNFLSQNIACFPLALSDAEGRGTMTLLDNFHSGLAMLHKQTNRCDIIIKKLDDFFEKIDVLKIDAEGSEADILKGGEDVINTYHPMIIFEHLPATEDNPQTAIIPYLKIMGYRIFTVHWHPMHDLEGILQLKDYDLKMINGKCNLFACHKDKINEIEEKFRSVSS